MEFLFLSILILALFLLFLKLERRVTDLLMRQSRQMGDTSQAMHGQIRSFTEETSLLREEMRGVQEAMKSISSFQEIFRSPKLRGEWGEANLEHVLKERFPSELVQVQYSFSSGARVDAVLKLPNGSLLPIDSKFPLENFEKMIRAEEPERAGFAKQFVQDVKTHVDSLASKYILPHEGTTDFALLYVPAEAMFYHVMFEMKEERIPEYARKKGVILSSPNTLYLTLAAIEHWFRDTQISKRTAHILRKLSQVRDDATKLDEDLRKLGAHLRNASSSYESSEKRLSLLDERIEKLVQIEGTEKEEEKDQ